MKTHRCGVYVFTNRKKDAYLVQLSKQEEATIIATIKLMHGGKVKVHPEVQPLTLLK